MFDGSSIEGFVRIEESDMLLKPDLDTFRILPYDDEGGRVARLLCDIYTPDEEPFAGCPRTTLKRQVERAKKLGFSMMAGCEAEFFLFEKAPDGSPATTTHDAGVLLRPGPAGQGRRDPAGDRRAARGDGVRGRGGAPRGGGWPARDRSAVRRCAHHGRQPDDLQVRGPERGQPVRLRGVVHAQADRGRQRQRDAHPSVAVPGEGERLLRPQGAARALQGRAELHRGAAAARARVLRGDQSADQQLQAAGAGVRGAGERGLVDAEPLAAGADSRAPRAGHPLRAPDAGSGLQPLSGPHGAARRGPRRHRAEAPGPGAGEPEHLHHELSRPAQVSHRRAARATCTKPWRCSRRTRWSRRHWAST